jgi:hypothetical protein
MHGSARHGLSLPAKKSSLCACKRCCTRERAELQRLRGTRNHKNYHTEYSCVYTNACGVQSRRRRQRYMCSPRLVFLVFVLFPLVLSFVLYAGLALASSLNACDEWTLILVCTATTLGRCTICARIFAARVFVGTITQIAGTVCAGGLALWAVLMTKKAM